MELSKKQLSRLVLEWVKGFSLEHKITVDYFPEQLSVQNGIAVTLCGMRITYEDGSVMGSNTRCQFVGCVEQLFERLQIEFGADNVDINFADPGRPNGIGNLSKSVLIKQKVV